MAKIISRQNLLYSIFYNFLRCPVSLFKCNSPLILNISNGKITSCRLLNKLPYSSKLTKVKYIIIGKGNNSDHITSNIELCNPFLLFGTILRLKMFLLISTYVPKNQTIDILFKAFSLCAFFALLVIIKLNNTLSRILRLSYSNV